MIGLPALSAGAGVLNVRDYGAHGDTRTDAQSSVSIASGSAVLTVTRNDFVPGDVGKRIIVSGAGSSGGPLSANIISVTSPTSIVLSATASTTLSAAVKNITWGTDDTQAWLDACADMTALFARGVQKPVYAPPGAYTVRSGMPTMFQMPGQIIGAGPDRTWIKLDPTMSGPLFSWSDCWFGGGPTGFVVTNTANAISTSWAGPGVQGLTITGDLAAPNTQHAMVLYDRADHMLFRDVHVNYLNGRALYLGGSLKNKTQAYVRESLFQNLRFEYCGGPGAPVLEITSVGTGNASNELQFHGVNMWNCGGPGVLIANQVVASPLNNIQFFGLRVEGGRPGITDPLLQIGTPAQAGPISRVTIYGLELLTGVAGQNSLVFDASSVDNQPYCCMVSGMVDTLGNGVVINAGRFCKFEFSLLHCGQTALSTSATTGMVGDGIIFDALGQAFTKSINNTSGVLTPTRGALS